MIELKIQNQIEKELIQTLQNLKNEVRYRTKQIYAFFLQVYVAKIVSSQKEQV